MLIDEVEIKARGGNGGNGVISFLRNGQTSRGGPDGGNGGKGGNLYLKGVNDVSALSQFAYTKLIFAEDGINGGKRNLYGKNGEDKYINVPLGTVITDLETNEVFDLENPGETILIAKGGNGGRGNNEFKSATVQAPMFRELGEKGEERKLKLELKLIADIGLIGLPNAGKSSLLALLTNARPKIGDYPFTTLEPNLGVMEKLILADIPGLIEGAHLGKGLGVKFLKHIERTKILVHCIDLTSENIKKDYEIIRTELKNYNIQLHDKREIIIGTKVDLLNTSQIKSKEKTLKMLNSNYLLVSIFNEKDLSLLQKRLLDFFD